MTNPTQLKSKIGALAIASLAGIAPAQAAVSLQTHVPTSNSTYTLTEDALLDASPTESIWSGPRLFFSAQYNVLDKPLVEYNADHTQRTAILYDTLNTLDLQAAIFPRRDLEIGVLMPLNIIKATGGAGEFGLGDSRLQAKFQVTGPRDLVAVSIIPELIMPSGNPSIFLSSSSFGAGARLAFEKDFGRIRASANIGYRNTPGAKFQDIDYSQQLPLSLGTYTNLGGGWGLNLEATSAISLPVSKFNNPGEFYLGTRYQISRGAVMTAGLSIGSLDTQGSGDIRGIVGVKFTPMPDPAPVPVLDKVRVSQAAPTKVEPAKKNPQRVNVRIKNISGGTTRSSVSRTVTPTVRSSAVKMPAPKVALKPAVKPMAKVNKAPVAAKKSSSGNQNSASSHRNEIEVEVSIDPPTTDK